MGDPIIIIDSDDEDNQEQKKIENDLKELPTVPAPVKRQIEITNGQSPVPPNKIRRIQPIKIGEAAQRSRSTDSNDEEEKKKSDANSSQESIILFTTDELEKLKNEEENIAGPSTSTATVTNQSVEKNEETDELRRFIRACKKAESNDDMKKIIKKKLLKNYHLVAPSYVLSSNFQKLLKDTADDILRDPKRVYSKIQDVVNELEARKHYKKNTPEIAVEEKPSVEKMETDRSEEAQAASSQDSTAASTDENGLEIETTGDKKKDGHLKKLNRALSHLKKKIEDLEEAEVNLDDDDDSAYMQKVRFEKRAMDIYNKICELTGESTHAHRIVKKPVKFKDSKYKEFNRRLTKKINRENGFPSYYDVYRLLDVCNKDYNYRLAKFQIDEIARSSFTKVGELLKERRCSDLYESACHWAGKSKDPAKEDSELKAKLDVNREVYRKKTEEVLEHFTKKQYEEIKSEPGTSKSFAVLKDEEEENEENLLDEIVAPNLPPPSADNDISMVSLIDVKAEEIATECNNKNDDPSASASVLQFSILS